MAIGFAISNTKPPTLVMIFFTSFHRFSSRTASRNSWPSQVSLVGLNSAV